MQVGGKDYQTKYTYTIRNFTDYSCELTLTYFRRTVSETKTYFKNISSNFIPLKELYAIPNLAMTNLHSVWRAAMLQEEATDFCTVVLIV